MCGRCGGPIQGTPCPLSGFSLRRIIWQHKTLHFSLLFYVNSQHWGIKAVSLPSALWIPAPDPLRPSCPLTQLSWGQPPLGSPGPGLWRPPASRAPAWWWPGQYPQWRWCGTGWAPWPWPAGTAGCILDLPGAHRLHHLRRCLWCSLDGEKRGKMIEIENEDALNNPLYGVKDHNAILNQPWTLWVPTLGSCGVSCKKATEVKNLRS